jgi:hypothetical protein
MFLVILPAEYGRRVQEVHDICHHTVAEIEETKNSIRENFMANNNDISCEVVYVGEAFTSVMSRIMFASYTCVTDFNNLLLSVEPTAKTMVSSQHANEEVHLDDIFPDRILEVLCDAYARRLSMIEHTYMDLPEEYKVLLQGIVIGHHKWIHDTLKVLVDLRIQQLPLYIPDALMDQYMDTIVCDSDKFIKTVLDLQDQMGLMAEIDDSPEAESEEVDDLSDETTDESPTGQVDSETKPNSETLH